MCDYNLLVNLYVSIYLCIFPSIHACLFNQFNLVNRIWTKRKDFKIVISSATIDAEEYLHYFQKGGFDVQVLAIEGRMYPVEIFYLNQPSHNYLEKALETAVFIHKTQAIGDVLVFLTGYEEINNFMTLFKQLISRLLNNS